MKKLLLGAAIMLTACNLAAGLVYADTCTGKNGSRTCGSSCCKDANGNCTCTGSCTSAEMDWVAGGGAAAMEEFAY